MAESAPNRMRQYETYLGRLIREYDLIWHRFKIFAGMDALLLIGISCLLILKKIKNLSDILSNPNVHFLINLFIVAGIIITLVWIMITWGSYQWITLMNEILEDLEKEIFVGDPPMIFKKIVNNKSRSEIVNVNIGLSIAFLSTWGIFLFITM